MKGKISDLRGHLFDVIERLKDPKAESPLDTKTAEAICLAAKRLIETADVELRFREQIGRELEASDFLEIPAKRRPRLVKQREMEGGASAVQARPRRPWMVRLS